MSTETIAYITKIETGARGVKKIRVKIFDTETILTRTYTAFANVFNSIKDQIVVGTFAKLEIVDKPDGYVHNLISYPKMLNFP